MRNPFCRLKASSESIGAFVVLLGLAFSFSAEPAETFKGSPLSTFPVLSHAGHYYQVVGERMNQENAQKHAASLGAHLATINSAEEQAWMDQVLPALLKQVSQSMATIGGRREKSVWKWSTGEPFEFKRWEESTDPASDPTKDFVLKVTATSDAKAAWGLGHLGSGRAFVLEWDGAPKGSPPSSAIVNDTTRRLAALNTAKELIGEGREIVLKDRERFTSPETYAAPVEFTIVAKTDSTNLRLAHMPKAVIFNWERNMDELRIDNDPGGARHVADQGRIQPNEFVTIVWRVMPHFQSISVNGRQRMLHYGDYTKEARPIEVYPMDSRVTLKSLQARTWDMKSLEEQVSSVPEMKEALLNTTEWTGKRTIPAGTYRPIRRIDVGAPGKKDPKAQFDEQRCDVTSQPGMRMENVRFHLREGSWKADGGLWRGVRITADLGGSFEAKNSLFENCAFAKEGPWYVALFSSRWTFTNCVFTGGFMENWKLIDVGMKLDACTFVGVNFIPIAYKADAAEEISKDWLSIRNCRFINCHVPESFALATKDCVFEKCVFDDPDEKLPFKSPFNAVIYTQDSVTEPVAGAGRSLEVRPAGELATPAGASLPHLLENGRLEFQTPPK